MSDPGERALKRANDLLRLADPKSGAPDAERSAAALEAAKVIAEHGLVAAPAPPRHNRRRQHPASPPPRAPPPAPPHEEYRSDGYNHFSSNWSYEIFTTNVQCVACGQIIRRGEAGWRDPAQGTRHYDITCYDNK